MSVLLAVIVLSTLGLLLGLGLAIANRVFTVETDPRIEQVDAALPQVNCGACGYSGCLPYAEALVREGAATNLCVPGGTETARAVARIVGVAFAETLPVQAYVHCHGGTTEARQAFDYDGIADCRAAALVHGGPKACKYGCLGFGTCPKVCPFDAITMSDNGLPVIDRVKCTGCGVCVRACPVGIIELLPLGTDVILACSNRDRGAAVKKICSVGCISCMICAKVTVSGAVTMVKGDALPTVHYDVQGETFDKAIEKCPMNCYVRVGACAAAVEQSVPRGV
ncbi:MAG TPA: RnfABCDGE type electron transport complex subunit B [Planctomycetota bacterium]|nr:RnfABCDGE type electron transport complex subunit B [Planctomycetota bacterium]